MKLRINKIIIFIILFIIPLTACSNNNKKEHSTISTSTTTKSKTESTSRTSDNSINTHKKLGINNEVLSNSNFNTLIQSDFSLIDTIQSDSSIKIECYSNKYKIVVLTLYYLPSEEFPSAYSVLNVRPGSNSTIAFTFETVDSVIYNSVPDENEKYVTSFVSEGELNEKTNYNFSYHVFNNEIDKNIILDNLDKIPANIINPTETTNGPKATNEQLQAAKRAREYIKVSAFSKKSLREQLKYEEFSDDAIQYALDNLIVNWNEQALKKANEYMNLNGFSEEELSNQLLYEGFDQNEVAYAVNIIFKH